MTLRIACSALGKRIFAGHLTKDGTRFREPRHDVTSDVLKAVIDKIEIGNEAEVSDGENIVARIAVLPPIAAPVAETAGEAIEDLWQELCERDDRTSPEEYPEMCLINFDELSDFITRAAPPVPAQDDDKLRIAVEALEETKNRVREWPIDDQETCMCGSPVASHGMGDGHSPVSQGDHAISMIVEAINEALAALKSTAAQEGGSK